MLKSVLGEFTLGAQQSFQLKPSGKQKVKKYSSCCVVFFFLLPNLFLLPDHFVVVVVILLEKGMEVNCQVRTNALCDSKR